MAVCARAVQQADGSYLLGLDPAVTDVSTCPYMVEAGSASVVASLGALTIEEAQSITGSVVLLWAICWGFRQVANYLQSSESDQSS